jgi:hypothetical protein
VAGVLDETGSISVELEPTSGDDAAFTAIDMTYQVREKINGADRAAYYIDVPTSPAIDLGAVASYDDPLAVHYIPATVDLEVAGYAQTGNATDKVRYVSASGSDSHDGLDWGRAKLTVQAAVDALSNGGTIHIGAGTYTVTSPMILTSHLTLIGAGRTKTVLRSTSVDLIDVTANLLNVNFRSLTLTSTASHLIDVTTDKYLAQCSWYDVLFSVGATNKSAINIPDGLYLGCLMDFCETLHSNSATVPTFNLVSSDNAINTNTFRRMWCTYSGNYVFHIESLAGSGGYVYDNTFEDINFEVTNGGCIEILSGRNNTIRMCAVYDLSGATTKDLFHFGASPGGLNTAYTWIDNVLRRGGTLGSGLHDVLIDASQAFTTVKDCDNSTGSGFTVDYTGSTGTFQGSPGVTLQNAGRVNRIHGATIATGQNNTVSRPDAAVEGAGARWYDTDLAAPIYSDGTVWRNAMGGTAHDWEAYTPTLGGAGWAVGDGTLTGAYAQLGKTVFWRCKLTFGGTSTYGAGSPSITLPVTGQAGAQGHAVGVATDASPANFYALPIRNSTTTVTLTVIGTGGLFGAVTSTAPITWASGDAIEITGTYEAA